MDRKIPRLRRVCRIQAVALLVCGAGVLILTPQTFGQNRGGGRRGGGFQIPTPEETFTSLDADRNGRLDADEINSNRFIPRMLGDTDISRGLSRDEFMGAMQRARENFGRGGPDSGRRRDRGGDRGPSGGESRSERDSRTGNRPEGDATNGSSDRVNATDSVIGSSKSRPRITIDLQSEFLPGDTDHDGQLGLYEWRRFAGRSLAEFRELDWNQDGFVTPREVAMARPELAPTVTVAATSAVAPQMTQTSASRLPAQADASLSGSQSSSDSDSSPQPIDERAAREAERYYRLLDKDDDGQIAPDEWEGNRIRAMFTDDGIDLSEPLSAEDFNRHYVRLSADPD